MRKIVLFFSLTAVCYAGAITPHPQRRPVPPGVREADKQANATLEASNSPNRGATDRAQISSEARELAELSSSIPAQIEKVNKGQVPKDLGDQLKRIEKLAKHLRSEIMP